MIKDDDVAMFHDWDFGKAGVWGFLDTDGSRHFVAFASFHLLGSKMYLGFLNRHNIIPTNKSFLSSQRQIPNWPLPETMQALESLEMIGANRRMIGDLSVRVIRSDGSGLVEVSIGSWNRCLASQLRVVPMTLERKH